VIQLVTVNISVPDNRAKLRLDRVPLSGIVMGTAIVYDANNVTVWHDSVRIEWEQGTAYAVFDEPVTGTVTLSYLVE
jgi:hypothetical protein